MVFPAALEDGCACAIGPNPNAFAAVSADLDSVLSEPETVPLNGPLHPADLADSPGWIRYAAGTFETMRQAFSPAAAGANIAVASDVPSGSGLSSSAALEVSIATALEALWGMPQGTVDKARACQKAENEFAGAPCGLMDQLVSVVGRRGHAVKIDFSDTSTEFVPMPPAELAQFVLFDSAVKHANDDGGYAERRSACESALPKLGVAHLSVLRAADLASLPKSLTPVEVDAVTHIVTENDRVERFAECLRTLNMHDAGRLMLESHKSLSEVYRVSCQEVDTLVRIASQTPGVLGARMTGGGFGGWAVALVESGTVDHAAASILEQYESQTGLASSSRLVRTGDGARVLTNDAKTQRPLIQTNPTV